MNIGRRIANSPMLLLGVFVGTMLTSSVLYAISEGTSFPDSVYWSLVTATTLGYGDFAPHSVFGKVLTSLLITFTVFIMIPTITANVAAWLIVNRDAFTHEEQEQIKDSLSDVLAILKSQSKGGSTKANDGP
jgi:voltage-gated potassium channel